MTREEIAKVETVKLIVELPKSAYRYCQALKFDDDHGIVGQCAVNAIADGTPLGDTNGEVVTTLFDGLIIHDNPAMRKYTIPMTYEFWNAPYKKESEE